MATRIRLKLLGRKNKPFYRIVVAHKLSKRDGKVIASLGYYDPKTTPPTVKVDENLLKNWQAKGAEASESVRKLLNL